MSEELAPISQRTIAVQNKAQAIHRLKTSLEDIVTIRSDWLEEKRDELVRAQEAHKALQGTNASQTRLRYSRHRVSFLRKMVDCLEEGFVPIPSFEGEGVNVDVRRFPLKALMAINDANASGLFDEIKFIAGREAERQGPWGRSTHRDPLLVGTIRIPQVTGQGQRWSRQEGEITYPAIEQDFLLAWWKPTDEVPGDMW